MGGMSSKPTRASSTGVTRSEATKEAAALAMACEAVGSCSGRSRLATTSLFGVRIENGCLISDSSGGSHHRVVAPIKMAAA